MWDRIRSFVILVLAGLVALPAIGDRGFAFTSPILVGRAPGISAQNVALSGFLLPELSRICSETRSSCEMKGDELQALSAVARIFEKTPPTLEFKPQAEDSRLSNLTYLLLPESTTILFNLDRLVIDLVDGQRRPLSLAEAAALLVLATSDLNRLDLAVARRIGASLARPVAEREERSDLSIYEHPEVQAIRFGGMLFVSDHSSVHRADRFVGEALCAGDVLQSLKLERVYWAALAANPDPLPAQPAGILANVDAQCRAKGPSGSPRAKLHLNLKIAGGTTSDFWDDPGSVALVIDPSSAKVEPLQGLDQR